MPRTRAGLYWKLHDRALPLSDRIKLVRYAWQHDKVYIPNKHQALLDWLAITLTNKIREPDVDLSSVWHCFRDVLGSKRCQHSSEDGTALVLKAAACQLLMEELQCHGQGPGNSGMGRCQDVGTVTSCCYSLMTSSTLGYTWAAKFDHLLHLLSVLCHLCCQLLNSGRTPSEQLLQLMEITLDKYHVAQRKKAHPLEVLQYVSSGLLLIASQVVTAQVDQDGAWSLKLGSIQRSMANTLKSALFHKELLGKYELYLKMKVGSTPLQGTLPKAIDSLCSQMHEIVQQKNSPCKTGMLLYLPMYYRSFVECYNAEENATGIQMFIYLCTLLKIDPEEEGSKPTISHNCLETLHSMLLEVIKLDVYNPTSDLDLGNHQLAWLQKLGKWLLKVERSDSGAWFSCLKCLLQLNYAVFDGQIPQLLNIAWLAVPQNLPDEVYNLQGELLLELLNIHEQLRQVHKFVAKMLHCLQSRCNECPVVWPKNFTESLNLSFTNLPQGVCLDVWQNLNSCILQYFLPKIKQGEIIQSTFAVVVEIFVQFLLNVRLADYNITQQTSERVEQLMTTTATEVLQPLLAVVLESNSPVMVPVLHMVWSWGELCLLLRRYGKVRDPTICGQVSGAAPESDMSLVYPFCSPIMWKKLQGKVKKSSNAAALFIVEKMCIQKVKALLLFGGEDPTSMATSIRNTTNFLFNLTPEIQPAHLEASWNGQVSNVCEANLVVGHWSVICGHLPMALPHCDQDQLMALAAYLLWTLVTPCHNTPCNQLTLKQISQNLLLHPEFYELKPLQSALVSTIWFQVAQIFKTERSGKKRKSEGSAMASCLEKLSLAGLPWGTWKAGHEIPESTNSNINQIFEDVSAVLQDLMQNTNWKPPSWNQMSQLEVYLKVLLSLPVEHLLPGNSLRCMMGILLLLINACKIKHTNADQVNQTEILPTCFELLTLTLEAGSAGPLFQFLHCGNLLLWFSQVWPLQISQKQLKCVEERYWDIVAALLRVATKQETCLIQLGLYNTLITTEIRNFTSSASMRTLNTTHSLQHCSVLLRVLARAMQKSYLKPEVKVKTSEYFTNLVDAFLKALKPAFMVNHQVSLVLASSSMVLEVGCAVTSEVEEASWWQKMLKVLPIVCSHCQDLLAGRQNRPVVSDDLQHTLQFVSKICQKHDQLQEHIPQKFICDIFASLIGQLQMMDSTQSSLKVQSKQNHELELNVHDAPIPCTFVGKIFKTAQLVQEVSNKRSATLNESVNGMEVEHSLLDMHRSENHLDVESSENEASGLANQGTGALVSVTKKDQKCVQQAAAQLLRSMSVDDFQTAVLKLLENVNVLLLDSQPAAICTSLLLWQQLLDQPLDEEPGQLVVFLAQNFLPRLQNLMLVCAVDKSWQRYIQVMLAVLQTQGKMLSFGPSLLSAQSVGVCLQSCMHAPLSGMSVPQYCDNFKGVFNIVDEMLMKHPDAVVNFLPPYVCVVKRLLLSLIQNGDQSQKLLPEDTEMLVDCALMLDKLGSLIVGYKTDFAKLATYIIADYVIEVQKVTLIPKVKKALLSFIYQMLSICGPHSIAQLHVVLPASVRGVFKTLYDEFVKYFKYTGKV